MKQMKEEHIQFYTQQSIESLNDRLRKGVQVTKASVDRLNDDPLGQAHSEEKVAVLLSGHNFMGGQRMWGVQVYLYDFGHRRGVELVALGDKMGSTIMNSYYGGGYMQFGDSKKRAARLQQILTEGDSTWVMADQEGQPEVPAPEVPAPEAAQAVSDEGVNLATSSVYGFVEMLKPTSNKEGFANMADKFFGVCCKKFADENPDFPACSELKCLYAVGLDKDSPDYYIYEPYLQLFPDKSEAVDRVIKELVTWSAANPSDVRVLCMLAFTAMNMEDLDSAHEFLYRILVQEKKGVDISPIRVDWAAIALATDFEDWFYAKYGNGQPAPAPVQAADIPAEVPARNPVKAPALNVPSLDGMGTYQKTAVILAAAAAASAFLRMI